MEKEIILSITGEQLFSGDWMSRKFNKNDRLVFNVRQSTGFILFEDI
jgi:hypothetical protein